MSAKKYILVVDDNPTLLVSLGDFLRAEGYEVSAVESGPRALDLLRARKVDLLLLDVSMPDMSGLHLLREIRATPLLADLPVLVFTCRTEMRSFFQGIHIEGFLSKAEPTERLLAEIGRILSMKSKEAVSAPQTPLLSVLLGEDDHNTATEICAVLESSQCRVQVVRTGAEVLEKAIVTKPHAVLIGSMLGNVPTNTVVSILTKTPGTRAIPVLVYTRNGQPVPTHLTDSHHDAPVRILAAPTPSELLLALQDQIRLAGGSVPEASPPVV